MEVQTRYAKNDRGNTRGAIPAPTGATRRGILALRAVLWPQADRHQGGNPGQSGRGDRFLGSQPIGQGRSSRRKGGRPESAIGFISPQPCTRCAHTASMPVVSIARRPAREAVSARLLIRACVNQSEKRGPSARGCPGVGGRAEAGTPRRRAMPSPTGQATRDVSGDATAAGLEPDRFFLRRLGRNGTGADRANSALPGRKQRNAYPDAVITAAVAHPTGSTRDQRTTQRRNRGCQRNPTPQTTGAGATTTGGATTTAAPGTTTTAPLGRQP
jgi:hypothetical protein